jgi:hypothetical protein
MVESVALLKRLLSGVFIKQISNAIQSGNTKLEKKIKMQRNT